MNSIEKTAYCPLSSYYIQMTLRITQNTIHENSTAIIKDETSSMSTTPSDISAACSEMIPSSSRIILCFIRLLYVLMIHRPSVRINSLWMESKLTICSCAYQEREIEREETQSGKWRKMDNEYSMSTTHTKSCPPTDNLVPKDSKV